ncbi:unnamed protein product [Spirodela intermedia]|uniref:Uncharacterized protein n=1 Tax=Spirodela intermedia TaxID=51605 RepID=A0A7I8LFQ4_SPIIN|nr:unnamed protein product [Spirodela intermedia]
MHRSGSKKGGMDELCVGRTVPPPQAGGGERAAAAAVAAELGEEIALLPRYDPRSDMARKEAARRRAAEGAVHIIPLVVLACAAVLWFFSDTLESNFWLSLVLVDGVLSYIISPAVPPSSQTLSLSLSFPLHLYLVYEHHDVYIESPEKVE